MLQTTQIIIGTSNHHKFSEIEKILLPDEIGIKLVFGGDANSEPPEETGKDFFENAFIKAQFYSKITGLPAIADDSGLAVAALDGAPGIFSARYAGEGCTYADNNRKLLALLKDIPDNRRSAKFICTAVLYMPDGTNHSALGILEGRINHSPRGTGGFGYDPVFEIADGRTVAELPSDEKNLISHRAKSFMQMRGILTVLFVRTPDSK